MNPRIKATIGRTGYRAGAVALPSVLPCAFGCPTSQATSNPETTIHNFCIEKFSQLSAGLATANASSAQVRITTKELDNGKYR